MKLLSPQRLAATLGAAATISMIGAQSGHAAFFNFATFNLSAFTGITATQNTTATTNSSIFQSGGPFTIQSANISSNTSAFGSQTINAGNSQTVNSNQF